jgi:hypothetical protein
MSGGYAKDINDTVEIHCNTIRAVRHVFNSAQGAQANVDRQSLDIGF